jgi:curved DNA-binding protein CbpA
MNGQLSEHPLAELIREVSIKNLSGRLRLQQDRSGIALYFSNGAFAYAASNLRSLRLRDYLQKVELLSENALARFENKLSDLQLAKVLSAQKLWTPDMAAQVQSRQVSDVLRVGLLWTEGTWEFDHRSHLHESVNFKVDTGVLILEAARRFPPDFAAARFRNPGELLSPVTDPPDISNVQPTEVFLLSRLDGPTVLSDVVALSGLREADALHVIYSLLLVGLIEREHWSAAFRATIPEVEKSTKKQASETLLPSEDSARDNAEEPVERFLERLASAKSYYEVLGVNVKTLPEEIKSAYYDLARRYHPDRFRKSQSSLQARIESAFARVTQAYDTLTDTRLRASYDSKLEAQARASQLAQSAPQASTPATSEEVPAGTPEVKPAEPQVSDRERAELQFKEGFAALELGQRNIAIGLFASAARAVPNEPRYRAYYGHALAAQEGTRRLAEAELQAAIKLAPNNAEYRMMLAELYRDLGFLIRARSEAERAVAADQNNRKARDLLRSLK